MNTSSNNGGPAFPQAFAMSPKPDQGMTLRDYFAAKAVAILAPDYRGEYALAKQDYDGLAADAYSLADAMLKEREAS